MIYGVFKESFKNLKVDYYPFGLKHKGYNNQIIGRDHQYGYNGKEEQNELSLEWLDFGARNYDAALGRWMNIDPLAEKKYEWTPFNYTSNDPLNRIDPDGNTDYDVHIKTSVDKEGNRTTVANVNIVYNVVNLSNKKTKYDQHYTSYDIAQAKEKFSSSHNIKNPYGEDVDLKVNVNVTFRSVSADKFDKISDNQNILMIVDEIPGEDEHGKTIGKATLGGNVAAVEAGVSMNTILHEIGHNLGFEFEGEEAANGDEAHSGKKSHLMYPITGGSTVYNKDLLPIWRHFANEQKSGNPNFKSGNSKQNAIDFLEENDIETSKKIRK